ncbi:hypothetical protein NLJ89_g1991 [Agrocybe chaxingu]|uniref:Uncharacterized protein n=1 Tax=Agrocybe chaxingu TaxID=84603 RepID=A0A9W8MZ05_9AGAR|nr:hypothetical protein NLJ89_g1991 [Agrocybe chaxingu]
MVRIALPTLAVALLAIPALAQFSDVSERDVLENDLYERFFDDGDDIVLTREDLDALFGREFVNDVEARDPFLGLLFKGVKAAVKIGKGIHKAHQAKQHHNNHRKRELEIDDMSTRELVGDDLEERDPFLGLLFKGIKAAVKIGKGVHKAHQAKQHHNNHRKRELDLLDDGIFERGFDDDEVFERGFDDEDFFEREFGDMEERDYYDELD